MRSDHGPQLSRAGSKVPDDEPRSRPLTTGLVRIWSARGFEVDGGANVVVRLHEDGSLAGYIISDTHGSWTIATTFFDIGGSFST